MTTCAIESFVADAVKRDLGANVPRQVIRQRYGISKASITRISQGVHAPGARKAEAKRCKCGGLHRPVMLEGQIVPCLRCELAT